MSSISISGCKDVDNSRVTVRRLLDATSGLRAYQPTLPSRE